MYPSSDFCLTFFTCGLNLPPYLFFLKIFVASFVSAIIFLLVIACIQRLPAVSPPSLLATCRCFPPTLFFCFSLSRGLILLQFHHSLARSPPALAPHLRLILHFLSSLRFSLHLSLHSPSSSPPLLCLYIRPPSIPFFTPTFLCKIIHLQPEWSIDSLNPSALQKGNFLRREED